MPFSQFLFSSFSVPCVINMDPLQKEQSEEESTTEKSPCGPEIDHTTEEQEFIEASAKGAVYLFTIPNQSRLDWWLKALKIRYWVDFGNQDEYRVDWTRKTGPEDSKEIVEFIIQLHRVKDTVIHTNGVCYEAEGNGSG